jgi:hypothetical protein
MGQRSIDGGSTWEDAYTGLPINLIMDPVPVIWDKGDDDDPAHYVSSGAGAAIAREVGTTKLGGMCSKLTSADAAADLMQYLLTTIGYDQYFDGKVFPFGAWVWSDDAATKLQFKDGTDISYSDLHDGDSAWQWLEGYHAVDNAATYLAAGLFVPTGNNIGCMTGLTVLFGEEAPLKYYPSPIIKTCTRLDIDGECEVGSYRQFFDFGRPAIIDSVRLGVKIPPTTSALIADVGKWNGVAIISLFGGTKPQIAATGFAGERAVDSATYESRCLTGGYDDVIENVRIYSRITQIGAGNPGEELRVLVRGRQFTPWLEQFREYDAHGLA